MGILGGLFNLSGEQILPEIFYICKVKKFLKIEWVKNQKKPLIY